MLISKVVIQWPDNSKTEHTINKTVSNNPNNESYFGGGFGYEEECHEDPEGGTI